VREAPLFGLAVVSEGIQKLKLVKRRMMAMLFPKQLPALTPVLPLQVLFRNFTNKAPLEPILKRLVAIPTQTRLLARTTLLHTQIPALIPVHFFFSITII
jgi:hypothetical protein